MCQPSWSLLSLSLALMSISTATAAPTVPRIFMQVNDYRDESQLRFDEHLLHDCANHYAESQDKSRCAESEQARIQANLDHFNESVDTFTTTGFEKASLSKNTSQKIQRHWARNKNQWAEESWPIGDTSTNHWDSPTYRVRLEDSSSLRGSSQSLRESVIEATKEQLQEWTGENLRLSSGATSIRVYSSGAIVSPHVAHLPQVVASAIINVAQDVREAWPMQVIARDGSTQSVSLRPGEMLLIESSSIIQGAPTPLEGKYLANMVVHFELATPTTETLAPLEDKVHRAAQLGNVKLMKKLLQGDPQLANLEDTNGWTPLHEAGRVGHTEVVELLLGYSANPNHRTSGGRGGSALYYSSKYLGRSHPVSALLFQAGGNLISPGSKESNNLLETFHMAVHDGDIQAAGDILETNNELVLQTEKNGWTALQFAVRGGHLELVTLLISNGAAIDYRTNGGKGGSTLFLAEKYHGPNHPVTVFLRTNGAVSVLPLK